MGLQFESEPTGGFGFESLRKSCAFSVGSIHDLRLVVATVGACTVDFHAELTHRHR
jgi:hypothetical protein